MKFDKPGQVGSLSAANFFARYHHYLIGLVLSTFLAGFMSEFALGFAIAGASLATALSLLYMPKLFDRSGTRRVLVVFGLVELCLTISLTLAQTASAAVILLTLQGICTYNIFLGLDLLMEARTTDERKTGHARGLFLVLANLSVLAASFSLAYILTDHNFDDVFLIAAAAIVPFIMLAVSFPSVSRVPGTHVSSHHIISEIRKRASVMPTMASHFLLLLFFVWGIYYLPLYLYQHIGFSWMWTGIIIGISILPYIIAEYPIGILADERLGEKEIAFFGFIIMALGMGATAFIHADALLPWIIVVLVANIGGAMVEVSTETHFFKHIAITDANLVSAFRMLRPIAAIAAPLIASAGLLFLPFQEVFILFGLVLLLGIPLVLKMQDTR